MRKEETIHIEDGERELTFVIRQMSAWALEKWMYRAFILLARAGGDKIEGFSIADAKDAVKGIQRANRKTDSTIEKMVQVIGGLDFDEAEPLLDALFDCVRLVPSEGTGVEMKLDRPTIEGNIESPITLLKLRMEVVKFNFGFFQNARKSKSAAAEPVITFPKNTKTSRR